MQQEIISKVEQKYNLRVNRNLNINFNYNHSCNSKIAQLKYYIENDKIKSFAIDKTKQAEYFLFLDLSNEKKISHII